MIVTKWDVCIAHVKYEDMDTEAVRPVMITKDSPAGMVIVECLKMTSKPPRAGEYALREWKAAGLHTPTVVRITKRLRLHQSKIIKQIGHLTPIDITGVEASIQQQTAVAV